MKVLSLKSNKQFLVALAIAFSFVLTINFFVPLDAYANAGQVQQKITNAGNIVKTILSSLVVLAGICAGLFIVIKRMKDADNAREKSELYSGVGRVAMLTALGASLVWLIPWVYQLFN